MVRIIKQGEYTATIYKLIGDGEYKEAAQILESGAFINWTTVSTPKLRLHLWQLFSRLFEENHRAFNIKILFPECNQELEIFPHV